MGDAIRFLKVMVSFIELSFTSKQSRSCDIKI